MSAPSGALSAAGLIVLQLDNPAGTGRRLMASQGLWCVELGGLNR